MSNRFVTADLHFGHTSAWAKFTRSDGTPLRPFSSTEEMDAALIDRWNARITDNDIVYVLGDVVINKKHLEKCKQLKGRKILVGGNHDPFSTQRFLDVGFEKIMGVEVIKGKYVFTHIPIHPDSVERFVVNVHGHLHAGRVMRTVYLNDYGGTFSSGLVPYTGIDPRYYCCSVEHTDFQPISFDELDQRIAAQWEQCSYTPPQESGWGNGSGPA